jgi:hypothetical protein
MQPKFVIYMLIILEWILNIKFCKKLHHMMNYSYAKFPFLFRTSK